MKTLETNLDSLIMYEPEIVNENANKDSKTFNTFRDLTAGVVAKSYALKKMLEHIAEAHQCGDIHFHDLDYHPFQPMTNCCLIDIDGMLSKGFQMGNAKVTSPGSVQTAAAQIVQIIANISSSQYGGVTVEHFDVTLGKYARLNEEKHRKIAEEFVLPEKLDEYVEERVEKDIKDTVQSFEYLKNDERRQKLLNEIDVLVDEPFMQKLYKHNLTFRGSLNQRIVDVKSSLAVERTVHLEGEGKWRRV